MRPFGFCLRKIICDRVKGRRKSFFFFFFCEREKETAVITVRLVRIVVDSAVEVPVALELFGDAKGIVGAAEVGRLVAIVARFHFRPHGPEPSPAGHFVGQNEPVRENTTFYAQKTEETTEYISRVDLRHFHRVAFRHESFVFFFELFAADFHGRFVQSLPDPHGGRGASTSCQCQQMQ